MNISFQRFIRVKLEGQNYFIEVFSKTKILGQLGQLHSFCSSFREGNFVNKVTLNSFPLTLASLYSLRLSVHSKSGSISVSGQLPTFPSPNPTLALTCCQLTVVELGEGQVGSCPDTDIDPDIVSVKVEADHDFICSANPQVSYTGYQRQCMFLVREKQQESCLVFQTKNKVNLAKLEPPSPLPLLNLYFIFSRASQRLSPEPKSQTACNCYQQYYYYYHYSDACESSLCQ